MRESPFKQALGYRPTVFSALSSVSTKSVLADRERKEQTAKLAICVEPPILRFDDFDRGKTYKSRLFSQLDKNANYTLTRFTQLKMFSIS